MIPPKGLTSIVVKALDNKNSTQENMKQKNAAVATPGAIIGNRMWRKNLKVLNPSTFALSSTSTGIAEINPSSIQNCDGDAEKAMCQRNCQISINHIQRRKYLDEWYK